MVFLSNVVDFHERPHDRAPLLAEQALLDLRRVLAVTHTDTVFGRDELVRRIALVDALIVVLLRIEHFRRCTLELTDLDVVVRDDEDLLLHVVGIDEALLHAGLVALRLLEPLHVVKIAVALAHEGHVELVNFAGGSADEQGIIKRVLPVLHKWRITRLDALLDVSDCLDISLRTSFH